VTTQTLFGRCLWHDKTREENRFFQGRPEWHHRVEGHGLLTGRAARSVSRPGKAPPNEDAKSIRKECRRSATKQQKNRAVTFSHEKGLPPVNAHPKCPLVSGHRAATAREPAQSHCASFWISSRLRAGHRRGPQIGAPPDAATPGGDSSRVVDRRWRCSLCGSRRPPLLAPLLPACAARLTALGAAHAPLLTPLGAGCAPLLTSLRARLCARRRGANRRGGRRAGLLGLSL
jgi:hypothetical protein